LGLAFASSCFIESRKVDSLGPSTLYLASLSSFVITVKLIHSYISDDELERPYNLDSIQVIDLEILANAMGYSLIFMR